MDDSIRHFRKHVSRELGDRHGAERRYSARLRQEAVACWRARERAGDALADVAHALGVAPMSLRRWAADDRVQPVHVVPDASPAAGVTVVVDGACLRIEGLDLPTAVQLIAHLR